jgi:uncharacterized protein (TIGR02466 family)
MIPVNIFPNFIYKDRLAVDQTVMAPAYNKLIEDSIIATGVNGHRNAGSTLNLQVYPHTLPEFQSLHQKLNTITPQMLASWGAINAKYECANSWINWHDAGAELQEHDHDMMSFVVTYYLKKPVDSGNIEFRNPLEYHWAGYGNNLAYFKEMPTITGDILLFPGWLKHRVQPNNSKERRVVLNMNFKRIS